MQSRLHKRGNGQETGSFRPIVDLPAGFRGLFPRPQPTAELFANEILILRLGGRNLSA